MGKDKTFEHLKNYLYTTLGILGEYNEWPMQKRLPHYLQNNYRFAEATIFDVQCLLLMPKPRADQTPATVKKQINNLKNMWTGEAIHAPQNISSFNRRRLIEHKIPFVVSGNQLYLPFLATHLRERFPLLAREKM